MSVQMKQGLPLRHVDVITGTDPPLVLNGRITGHNGADGSAVLFGDPDHGVGGSDLVDNKSILITGPFLQTAGPYFTTGYLLHFVQIQFIVQFVVFHG